MKTTRLGFPTTTAGCPSKEKPDLASLILKEASQSAQRAAWQARLSDEQRDILDDVRRRWKATRASTGVSAAHLARTIIAQMPECLFPKPKQLAQWLTSEAQ